MYFIFVSRWWLLFNRTLVFLPFDGSPWTCTAGGCIYVMRISLAFIYISCDECWNFHWRLFFFPPLARQVLRKLQWKGFFALCSCQKEVEHYYTGFRRLKQVQFVKYPLIEHSVWKQTAQKCCLSTWHQCSSGVSFLRDTLFHTLPAICKIYVSIT